MNPDKLIDDMIKENRDSTIKDFIAARNEILEIEQATELREQQTEDLIKQILAA